MFEHGAVVSVHHAININIIYVFINLSVIFLNALNLNQYKYFNYIITYMCNIVIICYSVPGSLKVIYSTVSAKNIRHFIINQSPYLKF